MADIPCLLIGPRKTKSMNAERVVEVLKRERPKTSIDLLVQCGFTLRHLGWGAFRNTYSIVGSGLVAKVPLNPSGQPTDDTYKLNIRHTQLEYRAIQSIKRSRRKWTFLQPYLPEVAYYGHHAGVIVMRRYYGVGKAKHLPEIKKLDRRVAEVNKVVDCDIWNSGNYALDREGNLKLIDFGCICEGNPNVE